MDNEIMEEYSKGIAEATEKVMEEYDTEERQELKEEKEAKEIMEYKNAHPEAKKEKLEVIKLDPIHQLASAEIIGKYILPKYRYKKKCGKCNGTGIKGKRPEDNRLVVCTRCVNLQPAFIEWKEYCKQHNLGI